MGMPRFVTLAFIALLSVMSPANADPMTFWDETQHGANSFNHVPPDAVYFSALADTGASWVRLTFSKWDSAAQDFLIGSADQYEGLVADDLAVLRSVLDDAHAAQLGVVLTPLTLPGNRWIQQNNGVFDDRLWSDPAYADQVAAFWRDLADALAGHPAIVGYNLMNEPVPERMTGLPENGTMAGYRQWQAEQAGGTRDLPALYTKVITAIRAVDAEVPIMLDAGYYASPRALASWPGPVADDHVLYAVHMYEPYSATSPGNLKRDEPLSYPGVATEYAGTQQVWGRDELAAHLQIGFDWAALHGISPNRLVIGEFGCMRRWEDCGTYLKDVLDIVERAGVHWAFYAFREDEWEGMDYEIPASFPQGRFYWFSESEQLDRIPRDGELMTLIKSYIPAK